MSKKTLTLSLSPSLRVSLSLPACSASSSLSEERVDVVDRKRPAGRLVRNLNVMSSAWVLDSWSENIRTYCDPSKLKVAASTVRKRGIRLCKKIEVINTHYMFSHHVIE